MTSLATRFSQKTASSVPTFGFNGDETGPPGMWLYLSGKNFVPGSTTATAFGVRNIEVCVYNNESAAFTVPKNAEGKSKVVIQTPHGEAVSDTDFTIVVPSQLPTFRFNGDETGPPLM